MGAAVDAAAVQAAALTLLLLLRFLLHRQVARQKAAPRGRVAVVVLGDFGRSPRMQYHALSLADQSSKAVCVVAYGAPATPQAAPPCAP